MRVNEQIKSDYYKERKVVGRGRRWLLSLRMMEVETNDANALSREPHL